MKGQELLTTSQFSFTELVLCLLHNRLWDYGLKTDMYGRKLSSTLKFALQLIVFKLV